MTPREILSKYGLKTDVKSIMARIRLSDGLYKDLFPKAINYWVHLEMVVKARHADLDLLCEMAEKVEKIGEVVETFEKWEKTVSSFVANVYAYSSLQEVVKILKGDAK